jgi:hypothetical protein
MAATYRPITLTKLIALVDMLEDISNNPELVTDIIRLYGSFLTIRNSAIYFMHQSVKDFLLKEVFNKIFPSRLVEIYYIIISRSL